MAIRRVQGLVSAAVALAMVAVSPTVGAYVRSETNWDPSTLPIQYRINTGSAPPSIGASVAMSALQGGEATWAGPSCTTWRATYAGTSTVAAANAMDGENTMLWRSDAWPAELGDVHVTIGVTTPIWTVGGYFLDADIQFNNVGFTWNTSGTGGTVDTQSIATHEQGHFLGLDHPPIPSAVMYASYSGGIKRTLAPDDISGVCAIYPSGGAVPDAGMSMPPPSTDPCAMYSSCAGCTPVNGCGWCGTTGQCVTGAQTGPSTGSCSQWAWVPMDCSGMTTPPPTDGGTPTSGGAAFGEPCSSPGDCASGGSRIRVTNQSTGMTQTFCTRACAMGNDCTCPRDYRCLSGMDSTGATVSFCIPGTSTCSTPPPARDAGTSGTDAGTARDGGTTGRDAGRTDAGRGDAAATADGSSLPGSTTGSTASCGCTVPGTSAAPRGLVGLLGLSLAVGVVRRRRRVA